MSNIVLESNHFTILAFLWKEEWWQKKIHTKGLLTGCVNKCMLEIWILCFDYKPMQLYFLKGWKSLRQIFIIYVHFFGTPISIIIIAILTYIFTINFFKHQLLLFDKYSLPSWLWHCTLHRHSLTSVHLVTAVLQWVVSKDIAISDTADTAPQQD